MKAHRSSSSILKHLSVLAFAAAACSAQAQTSTATYELIDLGNLNGAYKSVVANGLNAIGQVVGTGTLADGSTEAFVTGAWGQNMASLAILSGYASSVGSGINNQGQVVGTAYDSDLGSQAFTYDNQGGVRGLGTMGGMSTASAINNLGQIAGFGRAQSASGYYTAGSLFVLNADGSVLNTGIGKRGVFDIAGITDSGLIAGNYTQGSLMDRKGFVVNIDGSNWTEDARFVDGVNNQGQLAVHTYETIRTGASGQYTMTILKYAQTAINDQGLVGGYAGNGLYGGPYMNVELKDAAGNVIVRGWDFGTDMTESGAPAWSYTGIAAINNAGDFIINGGNGHAYLARAVPEPATVAYMLMGLAFVGAAMRGRKQA